MAFTALSCNEDVISVLSGSQSSGNTSQPTSEVTVEFNILDPDASPTTKVDTPENWGKDDGSAAERKINNIYLFAVDYDEETGTETVEEVVKADLVPGDFTATGVRTGHTFNLSLGTKRFYVGANMTEAHVQAFCNKTAMRADSYDSALAMVMENYDNKTGEGTNILMLSDPGKNLSDGKTEIDITTSRFFSISANLERLVSKVMVVAKYDGEKTNAAGRGSEIIPYIETSSGFFFDFQFILNNTNRALNINKTFEGNETFNVDPNWFLSSAIEKSENTIHYKNMWDVNANLSFLSDAEIKERLESTTNWYCCTIPSQSSSYLGQGLYCLENTVSDDVSLSLGLTIQEKIEAAYLATTHVYIKARFAPKTINGDTDNSENSTNERISHLYHQKDSEGNNPYTFYIHNTSGVFFTYTGVKRWIDNNQAVIGDFKEYIGGWVYFKTFFEEGGKDNSPEDMEITYDGINHWGIRRNDYCILTINDIVNWGSADPGDAYIKVKSETVPWNHRGESDVEVSPE